MGVVHVSKVDTRVQMDAAVLDRVDERALSSGRSRDQVIEDLVRRTVAGRALSEVLRRVRDSSGGGLTEDEASELAYGEVKAARIDRAMPKDAPGVPQR